MSDDQTRNAIMHKRMFAMLHARARALRPGDSVAEPLTPTSIFYLPDEPAPERIYGRIGNPTVTAVEDRLAVLENAPAVLFSSGMAAYTATILATAKAGDTVLLLSDGYYAARNLMDEILTGFGVVSKTCPTAEIDTVSLDGVRLAIVETPTNPHLDVIDIAALAARCRAAGCLLAVDNTVCTALTQQPLDLGADLVIVSDTKSMAGHSDLLLGHVASRDPVLMEKVVQARTLAGAIASPFDAWLLLRGMETLELRLARMGETAARAAEMLKSDAAVRAVRYPGLADDPAFGTARRQMTHPGFLIGATFHDKAAADRFISASRAFVPATSFGGLHSSADRRARWGDAVPEGFLRLSIGVEPGDELLRRVGVGLKAAG